MPLQYGLSLLEQAAQNALSSSVYGYALAQGCTNASPTVARGEVNIKLPPLAKFLSPNEYTPKQIIHNPGAVIVFWKDDTKTIVRRREGDPDDIHSAFAQALAKKLFGATTTVHKMVNKALKEQAPRRKE